MATALVNTSLSSSKASAETSRGISPLAAALGTAAACVAIVWVATTVLLLATTTTSTLGAMGVATFAAFWLGGGFGAIFGSAAAFGRDDH